MQQIAIYLKGERDYALISGSTGPLVYPGAHVWIYKHLYKWTDEGRNIALAQYIFAVVYLLTLGVVFQCYRKARVSLFSRSSGCGRRVGKKEGCLGRHVLMRKQVPPYIFPLLILSKRMHSIFMLRCFNDCFAVLFFWLAVYCYQRDQWHLGSALYSTGLNVKMSLLLPLPAMGILMVMKLGGREALTQAMIIVQVSVRILPLSHIQILLEFGCERISGVLIVIQVLYGYPFRKRAPSYFARAFELSRAFLYKWTVNWRFVPESTFLSRPFAFGLLALHAVLLIWYARTRWIKPSKRNVKEFLKLCVPAIEPRDQDTMSSKITPDFIMTTMLTAMTIGLLCARSLHYQFYAYIAWTTPLLLWKAGFNPVVVYALWGAQEWAWNVYPSTPASSATVVGVLAITAAGVWWGTRKEYEGVTKGVIEEDHAHKE